MGLMSGDVVIRARGLGKRYRIGCHERFHGSLRESLTNFALTPVRKLAAIGRGEPLRQQSETIWALEDVDLDVRRGEVLGVIGRNGAGKSTLLKILSRITEPTTGRVELTGRVGSLLEVGTGFHPELTGRENIFLNGAILGMTRDEVIRKFDEIVEFSEIERFLDTPVKRYSSGMHVRLAFAVAAHLEPDILIVDEVLAVGDAQFQKKCLGKMEDVGNQGRTVLLVSHNMAMISNLCRRGIVLNDGQLLFDGQASDAVVTYHQVANRRSAGREPEYSSETAEFLGAELLTPSVGSKITIHDEVTVRMKYRLVSPTRGRSVPNFHFFVADGRCAFVDSAQGIEPEVPPGVYRADCTIPRHFLNEGAYVVGMALTSFFNNGTFEIEFFDKTALTFNVVDPMDERSNRYGYGGPIPGVVRPRLKWSVAKEPA